jgi:4-amino-4-deoxy-L-arabinose transferase-like glycosyltransferase
VGLVTAAIAALWPAFWMNDGLVMSETLAAGGVALSILLAYRFGRDPTWVNAGWLGAAIGLSMLARAELGLLLPCMVLPVALFARAFSVWRRLALVVVSGFAALVVLSPWLIFNVTRFEKPSLLSTNDGLTLCGANNERSWYGKGTGLWVISVDERTGRAVDGDGGVCAVPQGTLSEAGIDASQLSDDLRADAFEFIGDHLDRLPVVLAVRVARVWSLYDPGYMAALNTGEGREEWASWTGTVAFWVAIPLTVAGVVVLRNRRVPVTPLVSQFVIVTLTAALIYGLVRFRVPAEISIVVLSAVAIDRLVERLSGRRRPGGEEAEAVESPHASAGEDPAALQPEPLS